MMSTIENLKERFEKITSAGNGNGLLSIRREAFRAFSQQGIPTAKHEEWKYTRIARLFDKEYQLPEQQDIHSVTAAELDKFRLPGHEEANELVFINGRFSFELSLIRSSALVVLPLEEAAAGQYKEIVALHLGHSSQYHTDGINALNMALEQDGVFIHIKKGRVTEHPVYLYHITDTRSGPVFAQPRSLVHIAAQAQVQLVETSLSIGQEDSFSNQVMEIIVEQDAMLSHVKIQDDLAVASQVSTTHIRQVGKSYIHTVTISLNGGIVRNNTNVIMEAEHAEAHLYGLYFQQGNSHVDNHTVVDNIKPNCYSNELYKGILDGSATGVFNGKIFVRPQAQKTNAYQSNKNVLLSGNASVNTKPQLEIFADDVKCSHGCTIGRLDEEGLFYLQSRGIPAAKAKSLLLHGFVMDIIEKIKPDPIRTWVNGLIAHRLELV